jgi:hypothetical protein
MLRMNEAPAIEVHVEKSAEPLGGMGETGTAAYPPPEETNMPTASEASSAGGEPLPS